MKSLKQRSYEEWKLKTEKERGVCEKMDKLNELILHILEHDLINEILFDEIDND